MNVQVVIFHAPRQNLRVIGVPSSVLNLATLALVEGSSKEHLLDLPKYFTHTTMYYPNPNPPPPVAKRQGEIGRRTQGRREGQKCAKKAGSCSCTTFLHEVACVDLELSRKWRHNTRHSSGGLHAVVVVDQLRHSILCAAAWIPPGSYGFNICLPLRQPLTCGRPPPGTRYHTMGFLARQVACTSD